MQPENGSSVLERLLDPLSRCLTPDSAKALVAMRADPSAQARVADLAAKCNQGQLSEGERAEYATYVHVGNLVAILQAKARRMLNDKSSA